MQETSLQKKSVMPFGAICQTGNKVEHIDKPRQSNCCPTKPWRSFEVIWKIAQIAKRQQNCHRYCSVCDGPLKFKKIIQFLAINWKLKVYRTYMWAPPLFFGFQTMYKMLMVDGIILIARTFKFEQTNWQKSYSLSNVFIPIPGGLEWVGIDWDDLNSSPASASVHIGHIFHHFCSKVGNWAGGMAGRSVLSLQHFHCVQCTMQRALLDVSSKTLQSVLSLQHWQCSVPCVQCAGLLCAVLSVQVFAVKNNIARVQSLCNLQHFQCAVLRCLHC